MNTDLVKKRIEEISKDGKLPCPLALALAKELNVSPKVIGANATKLKIKLSACQLGCFK